MSGPIRSGRAVAGAIASLVIAAACSQDRPNPAGRGSAPPPATATVAPQEKGAAERAVEEATRLMSSNPLGAARRAEDALRRLKATDPAAPRLHFIAGRGRLEHEQQLYGLAESNSEGFAKRKEEIAAEAKKNPAQYRRNELSAGWVYNGYHDRVILRDWPLNALADDAGYELTRLTFTGECEGFVACYVNAELAPLIEFLKRFPQSEFADNAVTRANNAFRNNLYVRGGPQPVPIVDLKARAAGYEPAELKTLLQRYTAVAATLPPRVRARAYDTIGDLWSRFGDRKKALELYGYIVRNVPNYSNLDEIGRRIRELR